MKYVYIYIYIYILYIYILPYYIIMYRDFIVYDLIVYSSRRTRMNRECNGLSDRDRNRHCNNAICDHKSPGIDSDEAIAIWWTVAEITTSQWVQGTSRSGQPRQGGNSATRQDRENGAITSWVNRNQRIAIAMCQALKTYCLLCFVLPSWVRLCALCFFVCN